MNRRVLLISNMYPSKGMPQYGVFVKNFKENLAKEGFDIYVAQNGRQALEKVDSILPDLFYWIF